MVLGRIETVEMRVEEVMQALQDRIDLVELDFKTQMGGLVS